MPCSLRGKTGGSDMSFQVYASNAKGDFHSEVVETARQADIRHNFLWNEEDRNGSKIWSMVRTTDLDAPQSFPVAQQNASDQSFDALVCWAQEQDIVRDVKEYI